MRFVVLAFLLGATSGCAGLRLTDKAGELPSSVNLEAVPFYPQTEFHCGPAALATMLGHDGVSVDVDLLAQHVYTPGLQGSLQAELVATARNMGRVTYRLTDDPGAVLAHVADGRPVLVLENHGLSSRPVWHYAVVVGYDLASNQMILRSGTEREQRVSAQRWWRRWQRAGSWAVVMLPPGQWPVAPERERWMAAASDFEASATANDAARVWQQTIERWPDAALAWLGLGNVEFGRADLQAAIIAYRRALDIEPDHAAVQYNLAVALQHSGKPCQAMPLFQGLKRHALLAERAVSSHAESSRKCSRSARQTP